MRTESEIYDLITSNFSYVKGVAMRLFDVDERAVAEKLWRVEYDKRTNPHQRVIIR